MKTRNVFKKGENGGAGKDFKICYDSKTTVAQTLFLGCSVKSFNSSLGWGAESSRLTVELVYDQCAYPILKDGDGNRVSRNWPPNHFSDIVSGKADDLPIDENGNSLVPGKVFYYPDKNSQKIISEYYYEKDPGFYADMEDPDKNMEIIGCPVYFKYNTFEFFGIVKSWERKIDANSVKSYSVMIESPSSLLSQTQVILGDYTGGIFVKDSSGYGYPSHSYAYPPDGYVGKIREQMMPNVVNVYGYLEDATNLVNNLPLDPNTGDPQYRFGRSGRTDEGIGANLTILAIGELLGYTDPFKYHKILRYAPFGRMVGPAPKKRTDGSDVDKSDYSEGNKPFMGLFEPIVTPDNEKRSLYAINLSEVLNLVPHYYRISDNKMSILDLVNKICSDSGRELYIDMFVSIENSGVYPVIRVRTIDRLSQPVSDAVDSYVQQLSSDKKYISSYSKGEEYNSDKHVRSMYIGGKQQRLYQVKNIKYAKKQSTLRYNALTDSFIEIDHSILQQYRFPDPSSPRNPNHYLQSTQGELFGRIKKPTDFFFSQLFEKQIDKGNYSRVVNLGPIGIFPSIFPSSDTDSICPYFGNNDFTGLVRKVYKDPKGFLVEFTTTEIAAAMGISAQATDYVRVSETELRAAMAGIDQYIGFLSAVLTDYYELVKTNPRLLNESILDTWTKVFRPIFGLANFPISMNYGILKAFNNRNNAQGGNQAVPNTPTSAYMTDNVAYNTIVKLQQYLKKIGDEYYGKAYMVNVPTPAYWTDATEYRPLVKVADGSNGPILRPGDRIQIGTDANGSPIYMKSGTQKTYFSFEPADSAWEEYGNYIDDTIVVGESSLYSLLEDNGTIPPIIGFNNNPQYNYGKNFNRTVWTARKDGNIGSIYDDFFQFWKYDIFKTASAAFDEAYEQYQTDPSWENGLILSDNADNVIIKKYNSSATDAFNKTIPSDLISKAYVKGNLKKELAAYVTEGGAKIAKLIVTIDPVFINPINPGSLSVTAAAVEFLAGYYLGDSAVRAQKILSLADMFDPTKNGNFNHDASDSSNKQYKNMSIAPKAAIPSFAALPLILNGYVYGPWINAPDLQQSSIFKDNTAKRLENLVGGAKVEIDNELVPWNYGSMAILDEVARLLVGQDNNYQLKTETGQITIAGFPDKQLGDELKSSAYTLRGPTITSINMQIGDNVPTTTYTFRTFTRKFTLFNKESADRLKNAAQNTIRLQKEMRKNAQETLNKLKNISNGLFLPTTATNPILASKLTAYSPMAVMVGYSRPYISPKKNRNQVSPLRAGTWTFDSLKMQTNVTMQDYRELPQEYDNLYSTKAIMSLDGLFSPISFYPTPYGSTTAYKKYKTDFCPICGGTKHYKEYNISYYCNYCEREEDSVNNDEEEEGSSGTEIPPYIISSGDDSSIIRNLPLVKNLIQTKTAGKIDYKSLNPIIMPVGELRNSSAQDNDFNAHHIDVIARGQVPMQGSISTTDNLAIDQGGLEFFDLNNASSDIDANGLVFDRQANIPEQINMFNLRFLGLRGPLVMAGWGYDTEGFPVPNASGEPKAINADGFPFKIRDLDDLQGSFDPNYEGTILGKNQVIVSGKWSKPKKEDKFLKGWGLRPDLWPVGPIDLRWDENRRVWIPGKSDPFVNIQLEDDLVPPYPARAFLNDFDRQSPLPSGLRRMIFVKDPDDEYAAPRGAKFLCKYNYTTGFYEPVNKVSITVTGLIINSNTARISFLFSRGNLDYTQENITPDPIEVQYSNPLGFDVEFDSVGIFTYFNQGWMLSAAKNKGCS